MSNMSVSEFKKTGRGDVRANVLLQKAKTGDPFVMADGKKRKLKWTKELEQIIKSKQYDKFKGNKLYLFEDENGNMWKLSDIRKTAEFGSSGGSGAGAEVTALAECVQAVFCALRQHSKKDLTPAIINDLQASMKKVKPYYDVDRTDAKMIKFITGDEAWLLSSIKIANILYAKKYLSPAKKYVFHRGSKFVDSIENTFKKLKPKQLTINVNKWTPADMWASEIAKFPEFANFAELNAYIDEQFEERSLIGISLKKSMGTPKTKEFRGQQLNVKFEGFKPMKTPFSSKDVYIVTSEGTIQLRSFNIEANIQGEIKGKAAAGGKVGLGVLSYAMRESFPAFKLLSNKDIIGKISQDKLQEMIKVVHKNLNTMGFRFDLDTVTRDYMAKKVDNNDKLISKIQSTTIGAALMQMSAKKRDAAVNALFEYASSLGLGKLFRAATFVKVY